MKITVLVVSWTNHVGYSEGDEFYTFTDRPAAVAKIRELWTDLGLDVVPILGDRAELDGDPDTEPSGQWTLPFEGHLTWSLTETELAVTHICDSDGREETHTLCSVCGMCDNGI